MANAENLMDNKERFHSSMSINWITKFHNAVEFEDETAVEKILKTGIDIEALNNHGVTALTMAVKRGHKPIIKLLLEYGADMAASCTSPRHHEKFSSNSTLLRYAVECIADESITELLLTVKPNFETASREIFNRVVYQALQRGNSKILKYLYRDTDVSKLVSSIKKLILVETRPAIDIQDRNNYSPLLLAIEKKKLLTVKLLLENNATLHKISKYRHTDGRRYESCTMLHMAALWYDNKQDEEMLRLLIDNGEDIDATTGFDLTALHIAIRSNKLDLVKILVSLGADIDKKSSNSRASFPLTPRDASLSQPDLKIFKYFAEIKKISHENLHLIASNLAYLPGELEYIADVLLQLCIRDEYKCSENRTLSLHLAIMSKNKKVIDSFFNHNHPNVNLMKWDGLYPIHQAAKSNNIDCTIRLLDLGANIDKKDEKLEYTALNYAVKKLHIPIILILLYVSADISALNNNASHQSLEFLIRMSEPDLIEHLLDIHSDIFHFYTPRPHTYFADIAIKHIIKSRIANVYANQHYVRWHAFRFTNTTKEFYDDCVKEIYRLQRTMICKTSFVPYYHFLTNNVRRLAVYIRNTDITENFKLHLLMDKFPIYGQMIMTSYFRALNHFRLILNFETVLADIFCHFPYNFTCSVSDYLTNDDLNMLLDC